MKNTQTSQPISPAILADAMSYEAYRSLIQERLTKGQSTGTSHSEALVYYTNLNEKRMNRLDKTAALIPPATQALSQLRQPLIWLVLTEGWCGDAAQIVPVFKKFAETSPLIDLKFVLRDQHLDLMDQFLTNGGRAIPKLIVLDASTLEVIADWGPRPNEAQNLFWEAKNKPDFTYAAVQEALHRWYAKDKTVSTQIELAALLQGL